MEVTVVPVVLGEGKPLFDRRLPGGPMQLIEARTFSSGMVGLTYEVRRPGESEPAPGVSSSSESSTSVGEVERLGLRREVPVGDRDHRHPRGVRGADPVGRVLDAAQAAGSTPRRRAASR